MGASNSKIVFKQGIFRLSEERNIPADDTYWTSVGEPNPVAAWLAGLLTQAPVLGASRILGRCI